MSKGRFGIHGGQYIPETLMNAVLELEEAYNHYKNDPEFNRELTELLNEYAGRPSRLYYAAHMTEDLGTQELTRSTTFWDRYFLQKKWARPVSSQRQEPASMVLQLQQQQL